MTESAKTNHLVLATEIENLMNDVMGVLSTSGENLESIACIVLEIHSLEARSQII